MAYPAIHILATSVEFLKGVGAQKAQLLKKELNIATFGDVLLHFPYRYLDGSGVQHIAQLRQDMEYVQLRGVAGSFTEEGTGFKKRLKTVFYDQTGQVELVWFQGLKWVRDNIVPNRVYTLFGKLSYFNGMPSVTHPEMEPFQPDKADVTGDKIVPLYATTEKLRSRGITNKTFGKLVQQVFGKIHNDDIRENLPLPLIAHYKLMPRSVAAYQIHFPQNEQMKQGAIRRMKWEELFLTQMQIARLKIKGKQIKGFTFPRVGHYFNDFYKQYIPFELTGAQKRVLHEIRQDTRSGIQMNRLVQGDVGSGKTMVALMSMLLAVDNGFQACLMAPTEILAQQHYESIRSQVAPLGIIVAILTGTVKGKARRQILEGLQNGAIHMVIGTHALVEDTVKFKNLGLAVIDEQHRFGVGQRARLWQKNTLPPHILVMTATPIPRTLAMTIYGDLDVSVIDELPPGRQPIQTIHRADAYRPRVMQFVREEIKKGRQAYFVYPLIDESDKLSYESLNANYEQVKAWFPYPQYKIAMVHGRQPQEEKENNMDRFVRGLAHILVATTVIEVGVNVPNATVMVIESAERFGLSQLHQLRGRVGRGAHQSYCMLMTANDISKESRQRMSIMTQTTDGFVIAEEDLRMRGPGDIYGTRQSGALEFKIADIVNDSSLLEETRKAAEAILAADPELKSPAYSVLHHQVFNKEEGAVLAWDQIS